MRKPLERAARRPVLSTLLTLLFAGSLLTVAACTAGEGATPTCKADVTAEGNLNLADGCNKFAVCRDGAGNVQPAAECCKDSDGKPFQGQTLNLCLYGYGEDVDLGGGS